jgi:aquaporin Z
MIHRVAAECIGTFALVFFAVGSAVFGILQIGPFGIALAFGVILLALAYALGPISGCHVNPAVTLGVLGARGIRGGEAGAYIGAQLVGGLLAGGLLKFLTTVGGIRDETGTLGTNGWAAPVTTVGAFVIEVALTALLVTVVLLVTRADAAPGFAGLAIGLVLTGIHLAGIPVTGTSVNPARSIGVAAWYPPALGQLWLFVVAPLVGGAVAIGLLRVLAPRAAVSTGHDPSSAADTITS